MLDEVILVIAIAFGTINVVGGFLVTDRMLEMFKKKPTPKKERVRGVKDFLQDPDFISSAYIVSFSLFIIGLRRLTHPSTARQGNKIAAVGMAVAVVATLLQAGDRRLGADRRSAS